MHTQNGNCRPKERGQPINNETKGHEAGSRGSQEINKYAIMFERRGQFLENRRNNNNNVRSCKEEGDDPVP